MIDPDHVAAARLLLVEAPAGYGKSAFAERVLAARVGPVVRLRPGDPPSLTKALRRALRRVGLELDDDGEDAEALVDAALAALARLDSAGHLLVEDAHRFGPEALSALTDLLDGLPAGCTAVVFGRDLSSLRRLAARPGATSVGVEELRLSAGDIAALVGLDAGHATVHELAAATQGWPAAVELAAARLRREPTWSAAGASGVRALLRDLVDEVASADPRLPLLARLPLLDEETLRLVSPDDTRPPELPLRPSGRWLLLPDAIRELFPDVRLPTGLVTATAAHYHRNGETPSALGLLREQRPEQVVSFLSGLPWAELEELDVAELRAVVEGIDLDGRPPDDDAARLVVNAAKAVELHDRPLRAAWLTRLVDVLPAGALRRAAEAEQARDRLRSGELDPGADQARAILASAGPDESATRGRALVTIGMREAYDCTPDSLAAAARTFREAATCYQQAGDRRLLADTLARLGYTTQHIAGYPREAQESMSEALALLPVGDRARALWLTMYADVLEVLGRSEESDAAVREALDIGERRRDPMTSGMAWWTRSWTAALRGDVPALKVALAEVERLRGDWLVGGQEAEFLGSSAELLTLVGDLVGYDQYVERAQRIADEVDYPEVVTTPRAFHAAEHGDPAEGLRLLDELETMPGVAPGNAARRLLLRSVALLRSGREDDARAALSEALQAVSVMGVPDLLHRQHPRQVAQVAGLLAEAGPREVGSRLQLLGGFALATGDGDRTPQPGHPATLVKVLGLGATLTTDAAIDLLWPDADLATGRARLRNTLNRLKERSGALVVRRGDLVAIDDQVTVDATGFERAAAEALAAPPDERVGRARHALALYTGELLPGDVYADWAAVPRARLQRLHVSLLDLVAEDAVSRGELDEAARLLDLGIAAEPLDDARPLRLCRLLAQQGRAGTAREVARRALTALDELGVDADPELLAFAAR